MVELEAVQFVRSMTVGRTGPFLVVAEDVAGRQYEVVVKATNPPALGPEGLIREAIAVQLGRRLGLPMQEAYAVRLGRAFVQSVTLVEPALGARLAASIPLAFGTEKLSVGYSAWSSASPIPAHAQQQAEDILVFDLLTVNGDRRPANPNMQWNGTTFALFDHELALIPPLFGAKVWDVGSMNGPLSMHIFGPTLKPRTPNLVRLGAAWTQISDVELAALEADLPAEWTNAAPSTASEVLALVKDVRDNFPACSAELTRALQ